MESPLNRFLGALLAVCLVSVAACGDGGDSVDTATAGSGITLSQQDAGAAALTANNMAGPSSATDADWIDLATDGCRRGAWDWDVARVMAEEFVSAHPALATPDRLAIDHVLWVLVTQSCPDLAPADASTGPPPG